MSADTKPTVAEAWKKVMEAVQAVKKTGYNKQQDYSFRGIDAVVNAAGPAVREHGVMVLPSLLDTQYRDVEVGQRRTLMREVTVKVRYTIFGPAGDVLTVPGDPEFGVVPGESLDSGDKGTAKAMSVAYRTFLLQALMIPTDEPDPDSTSVERSAAVRQVVLNKGQAKYHLFEVAKELTEGHEGPAKQLAGRVWTLSGAEGREEFDEGSMATLADLLRGLSQPHVREALEAAEGRQAARDSAPRPKPAAGSPAPTAADPNGERVGAGDTGEQQSLVEAGS